eukprot:gene4274-4842_t
MSTIWNLITKRRIMDYYCMPSTLLMSFKSVISIQSPDTDVLILSIAHISDINCAEFWFKTGAKAALAFHSITGCDSTSALAGIGKKKGWQLLSKSEHHQESLSLLGSQPNLSDEVAAKCEDFICDLYPAHRKMPHTNLPDPKNHGWGKDGPSLKPVYMTKEPLPSSLLELTTCACKSGCQRNCSCTNIGLSCSETCFCMASTNVCKYPHGVLLDISNDSDDSEYESD